MKQVTTLSSAVAVSLMAVSGAGAQVAPEQPVAAQPPAETAGLIGTTGGIASGVVIAAAVMGSLVLLTILNSDGTISTTTTAINQ